MKKWLLLIAGTILLTGCNNITKQEITEILEAEVTVEYESESVVETVTQVPKKPITEYEDCTAKIKDTFLPEGEYEVQDNNVVGCWVMWEETVEGLCEKYIYSPDKAIVAGEVVGDIGYKSLSDTHQEMGTTYYTFAVTEVLYGDMVKEETLITVRENDGFTKSDTQEGAYIYTHSYGAPMAQVGDKYVLFLDGVEETAEGTVYPGVYFMNKYFMCDDGLYRRYSAVYDSLVHEDVSTTRYVFEDAMTYEEIRQKILDKIDNKSASGLDVVLKNQSGKETIINKLEADLDNDGINEQLEVVAMDEIDVNIPGAIERFVQEDGKIIFRIRCNDGEILEYSEVHLYNEMCGNGQISLVKDTNGYCILYTTTWENRWSGAINGEIRTMHYDKYNDYTWFGSSNEYEGCYESYVKMRKNPLDNADKTKTAKIDNFKEFLSPWMEESILLIAVDYGSDRLVWYSTGEKQINAMEYYQDYFEREETFVEDNQFYK